jgi:anti-sigma regulatory factor (Ser/Thr protein kinase)
LPEFRRALCEFDLPSDLLEDARLLVTELVSNSIRHAGLRPTDLILVRTSWNGARLRIEVRDGGAEPGSASLCRAPGSEAGWGLYLVDRLAARWGARAGRWWFELDSSG